MEPTIQGMDDTIDLTTIDLTDLDLNNSTMSIIGQGNGYYNPYSPTNGSSPYTYNVSSPYTTQWSTVPNTTYTYNNSGITPSSKLEITGENADIVINGMSLLTLLKTFEKRLSILQPKTELLEKYEALQQAYEHYKTLEALLYEEDDNKK